jgi:hypothetical protein
MYLLLGALFVQCSLFQHLPNITLSLTKHAEHKVVENNGQSTLYTNGMLIQNAGTVNFVSIKLNVNPLENIQYQLLFLKKDSVFKTRRNFLKNSTRIFGFFCRKDILQNI